MTITELFAPADSATEARERRENKAHAIWAREASIRAYQEEMEGLQYRLRVTEVAIERAIEKVRNAAPHEVAMAEVERYRLLGLKEKLEARIGLVRIEQKRVSK